jgi:CRISPR-associated endonuclease/helicase Cas3
LHTDAGGYTAETGWNPVSRSKVAETPYTDVRNPEEAVGDDPLTFRPARNRYCQSLAAHSVRVVEEVDSLLAILGEDGVGAHRDVLIRAAQLHDWGKAHPEFQKTLHDGQSPPFNGLLAKSCSNKSHARPHLRHELASALALLSFGEDDLVAYLVAAHHGRLRLTLRSMPDEYDKNRMRGVQEGEILLGAHLGDGVVMPDAPLSLNAARLGRAPDGGSSWTERMSRLRDQLGPFRLAYLEALLRIADERASADPGKDCQPCHE